MGLSPKPRPGSVSLYSFRKVLNDIGYSENPKELKSGVLFFRHDQKSHPHMPETLTLFYPSVSSDGHLYFDRGYVIDVLDRISDGDDGDGVIFEFLRKLDS